MQQTWHVFPVRKRTPFYVDLYTQGLAYASRDLLNFPTRAKLYHINGSVAMKESEFQRERQRALARLRRDPRFLLRAMQVSYRDYTRFRILWQRIGRLNVASISNKALIPWLRRYAHSISAFWWPGMILLYVEQDLTAMIEKYVAAQLQGEEASKALGAFFTPKKEGIVGAEYRSLFHIAALSVKKREAALQSHWENFAWMANQLFTHTFFPLSHYRGCVMQLEKKNPKKFLRQYVYERQAHLRAYTYWMRKLKPGRRTRLAIESLNEAIFYRSWRGEKPYESGFIVAPLMEEIAKRLKLTPQDLLFCTAQEIIQWLTRGGGQWKRVIAARKKGFVYIPTRNGKILTGRVAKKWERVLEEAPKGVHEIKGTVAFPGMVRGSAHLVHGADDLPKVKQGDVLIAVSITPLYVPILHKVRAIVTEEGGVFSHVSVISREMQIPCVIGTKIATRVFKDGDRVEVDATRGIVRKI